MKGFLVLVCLFVTAIYCQGGTRGPCSAVAIPVPFSGPISLFGSTTASTATAIDCNSDDLDGPTTWYSLTPASGTQVKITTCGPLTNFDTILVVYSGNCKALTCVTLGDDSDCQLGSTFAQVHFISTGQEYFVAVTGSAGATGQYELTFSEVAANTSSTCQTATAIPGPYAPPVTFYGDNSDSVGFSSSTCGMSSSSHIDWYILTPNPGNQVEVSTCNTITNFDSQLAILTETCSALTCLTSNDDNCTTSGTASSLSFTATSANQHYYLAVFGYGSASGSYEVRIIEHSIQSTPGGDCASAIPLPFIPGVTSLYFGNTEHSLTSAVVACASILSKTVWYRIDVPSTYTGTISATTCNQGTDFDTVLAVYSGQCDRLRCVIFNDDSCSSFGYASSVSWTVSQNSDATNSRDNTYQPRSFTPSRTPTAAMGTITYWVQVAGFGSNSGPYALTVSSSQ